MSSASDGRDDDLLERARAGDREALERLVARHQAQVYRFGLRLCRDPEDAKDLAQETLLALARGIGEFRGASSLSTWLYAVARSHCIKKRRRGKHAPVPTTPLDGAEVPDDALADGAALPDDALAARRVERALDEAIAGLDPAYRDVLVLRDVEGLTAPEVAEVMGLSVQAVKSRLHRARLTVRDRLAPLLEVPGAPAAPGTCPDVLRLFSRHLEDEISPAVCARMERHLAQCPRCKGACDSLRQTLALCRTGQAEVQVPADVQVSVKRALRDFLATPA
jgi:RNA polymerase sigma-70 factor (ECF subfamily)